MSREPLESCGVDRETRKSPGTPSLWPERVCPTDNDRDKLFSRSVRIVRMSRLWGALYRTAFRKFKHAMQLKSGPSQGSGQSREAQNQQVQLLTSIALLVVMTTGFVQWLSIEFGWHTPQASPRALQFHEAFYYTVVTLSTLGYGDYYPYEGIGQFVMTFLIVFFIFAV